MPIIDAQALVRKFGDVTAVNGVQFAVERGEIFGFLGPNGAGKTTTIGMLCTLLRPTAGRAFIDGHDVVTAPQLVRQSIGMIFQDPTLDDRLTGHQNLKFHAMLYDVPRARVQARAAELLDMVDLTKRAGDPVRQYSGGMKRRLEIVRGLLHQPKVLFLDEPTIGLDPQTRRHIWSYLRALRDRQGVTMFMTTHYMDEAEHCDRIAIIDHGEIVALDTPAALKGQVGGDIVTVQTDDNVRAAGVLERLEGGHARVGPSGALIVETREGSRFIPRMMEALSNGGAPVQVQSVSLTRPTLEDVFVKLTGHAIREQGADSALRQQVMRWRGR